MESPLYINYGNKSLFGVLHTPENTTDKKGIIFIHPYAEEKQRADRIFVHVGRLLCSKGFYVIRFDFHGCGDSGGDFEELTFESQISDLRSVLNFLVRATEIEEISLFGIRLGANIAVQFAGIENNIDHLILWSPIINGADYVGTLIRNKIFSSLMEKKIKISRDSLLSDLNSEGRVDIDGYYLTKHYYDYLNKLDIYADAVKFNGKAFIGINKYDSLLLDKYKYLAQILNTNGNKCNLVLTDDKLYWDQRTHYEWYYPNNLIQKTLEWINNL